MLTAPNIQTLHTRVLWTLRVNACSRSLKVDFGIYLQAVAADAPLQELLSEAPLAKSNYALWQIWACIFIFMVIIILLLAAIIILLLLLLPPWLLLSFD